MSLKRKVAKGLVWTFTQQSGNYIVSFIVSIFLARMLMPREFGLIGMVAIVVSIGNVLTTSGLAQSLIRSNGIDDEDYSTVFFFNILIGIVVYLFTFFSAPYIAGFYNQDILTNLIRWYGIIFIIAGSSNVQLAILSRKMDFKTQTIIALPSTLLGGFIGISMAYLGFGVWSLVCHSIAVSFLNSLQLWIYSNWTPVFVFNLRKLKKHFKFAYYLTLASLLDTLFKHAYIIIIGKFFMASQVGFYTRADSMKQLPINSISSTLKRVTFPAFSGIQDDNVRLKNAYRKLIKMVLFILTPLLIYFVVLAEPIFRFLFTEKWLPAVPYFQILCIGGIFYPLHSYNLNILQVKGRSDLVFKLAVVKLILATIAILIGIQFGIYGLLYGQVALSLLFLFINSYYTDRFIHYSFKDQMLDILPIMLVAVVCGCLVGFLDYYVSFQFDLIRIILGMGTGIFLYTLLSIVLRLESLIELKSIVQAKLK